MVFSNALLVFMISLQFGMYDLMIDNTLKSFTGHVQVQAPGYKDEQKIRQVVPGADALADTLRTALGIESVAVRSAAFALLSSEDRSYGVQLFGIDPDYETRVSSIPGLVVEGRYPTQRDAQEIVIGDVLARNLRVELGDEITLLGSGRDGSFAAAVATVIGIFNSGVAEIDRNIAELPIGFFNDVFYMEDAAHSVVVLAPALSAVEGYVQQIESQLPAGETLVVHDWEALQPGLRQAITSDMTSAWFTYIVLIVLVAFSVLNTLLMSVLERTREFGVMLALGVKPAVLARLVAMETLMMALLGLAFGVVLGWALSSYLSEVGFAYPGMDELGARFNMPGRMYPEVSLLSLLWGPAVVMLGTLLAAVYPALRLFRLAPVEAMRAV